MREREQREWGEIEVEGLEGGSVQTWFDKAMRSSKRLALRAVVAISMGKVYVYHSS